MNFCSKHQWKDKHCPTCNATGTTTLSEVEPTILWTPEQMETLTTDQIRFIDFEKVHGGYVLRSGDRVIPPPENISHEFGEGFVLAFQFFGIFIMNSIAFVFLAIAFPFVLISGLLFLLTNRSTKTKPPPC